MDTWAAVATAAAAERVVAVVAEVTVGAEEKAAADMAAAEEAASVEEGGREMEVATAVGATAPVTERGMAVVSMEVEVRVVVRWLF